MSLQSDSKQGKAMPATIAETVKMSELSLKLWIWMSPFTQIFKL